MLNNDHFYYRLIRKYVIVFGSLFNQIIFLKYNADGSELSRMKVPIIYAPKDKMVTRFLSDPDLLKQTQNILPRISFEIVPSGITYDPTRKQNSLLRVAKGDTASSVASSYMGVPYNIVFELNVYTKNIDDGAQIVEQIFPHFNPDYTITVNTIPQLGFLKDIPIILDNVIQNIQYEGNYDSVRYVNWTFTFTIKGYFFGPITTPKIIKTSIANIFNDPSLIQGYVTKINLGSGSGKFAVGDTVYQGDRFDSSMAYGIVNSYDPAIQKLILGGVQGSFSVNSTLRSSTSNGVYQIASFDASPINLASITVTPDPTTAGPTDPFNYNTTITEWPYTESIANT